VLASCDEGRATPGIQDGVRESFDDARAAAESAAALSGQLLALSRRQFAQPRLLDLNDIIGDTRRLIARLITASIDLEIHQDQQLGLIMADANQIQQVLVNLAVNARDAMPNGGRLVIEARNVSVGHEDVMSDPRMRPGRYILLVVSDSGMGMDDATLAHLFEPFFTTKAQGKGTGLGLSTVHGIVTRSGGFIRARSEVGRGTTFKVYFPRIETGDTTTVRR